MRILRKKEFKGQNDEIREISENSKQISEKKIQKLKSKSNSKSLRIISELSQKGYKKHQIIPVINGNVINLSTNLISEREKKS